MGGTTLEIMMPSTLAISRPGRGEEIAEQDAPLVGGLFVDRAQAPLEDEFAAFESADGDVAVTCVKSQQHVRLLQESGYRFHRPGAR